MINKKTIVGLIAIAVWTTWLILLTPSQAFTHLINHWQIAITMMFGSMIAGGTSLGGGAVAFPVFTKLLHISPHDARIFSLAIQSVGMSAATIAICFTRIRVEWRIILWGSLGGFLGIFLGAGFLAPIIPAPVLKMVFTTILTSFAVTLFTLNQGIRTCHLTLPIWTIKEQSVTVIAGFLGGIMSGLVGNGIDIFTFSVMVLLFRLSEKVATPTSVILMAINAIAGFALQVFVFNDFTNTVQNYWLAAIPVVVVGAPLGAMFCSRLHRQTIANSLIGLIVIEMVSSILLIPLSTIVIYSSLVSLMIFSTLNYWMYRTQRYELPNPSAHL
ncbi:MAG: sulfite exporter TauE/SafE family protein [Coleofasciculus sp.]